MHPSFGQTLRELRREAGLSQRELADKVNLDFSYISKLENDRIPPPAADTVVVICEVLGIPSSSLLALVGKLPSEVERSVATVPEAQQFLRDVHEMRLSDVEWREVQESLRRLREKE